MEHFLLQPRSSCHFSCTWAHLRPDRYRANSFTDKELKSPRGWKHKAAGGSLKWNRLCISNWTSLPRPVSRQELAGTVLTSWGVSHHTPTHQHTRWRGQDILTPSTPTEVVQDHYGFSLLWLCSMKIRQGIEPCICHSKISHRAQSTATRGSGHQQAAEAFCWPLRWMRWAFISSLFPSHFRGRPSIQIRTNTRSSEYKHSAKHVSTRTPTHKPMHTKTMLPKAPAFF